MACLRTLNQLPKYFEHLSQNSRNLQKIIRSITSTSYEDNYKKSIENPEEYWYQAASQIVWFKKYRRVLEKQSYPRVKWFPGGELNTCYNALDKHIDDGRGDQVAIIYDSPVIQTVKKYTYIEMLDVVSKLSGQLVSMGVQKGDRVLIYMPVIPEAVFSMLACARIGAIHTVVFGGFAAKELAARIRHTRPKVILSATCGIEPNKIVWYKPLLDEAIKLADLEMDINCIIYQREQFDRPKLKPGRDYDWVDTVLRRGTGHDCVPVAADHPLYILYTSGTTGFPKGIVRSTGGHTVALPWSLKTIFGLNRGDTWWAASDLGWVVGHSYMCYGPFLYRLTNVLYEGKPIGTPNAAQYYRIIAEHGVNAMFVAPSSLRTIRKEDPENNQAKQYTRKSLKNVFVAGEHCDNDTLNWAKSSFHVPILNNWWQTETGHPITATCVGLGMSSNVPKGTAGRPVPGYDVKILNDNGREVGAGKLGKIVCKHPMPPGFMETLFKSDELFASQYFQRFNGYYDTMDAGYMDEHGYVYVTARDDDVINVAGHRLSTSHMEEVICDHENVSEGIVVAIPDPVKGSVPLCIYVIAKGTTKTEKEITKELVNLVKTNIGPVAAFKLAVAVPAIPKTRSGKTPRKSIAELASNKTCQIPPTIEDHTVYEALQKCLRKFGLGKDSVLKF